MTKLILLNSFSKVSFNYVGSQCFDLVPKILLDLVPNFLFSQNWFPIWPIYFEKWTKFANAKCLPIGLNLGSNL